MKRGRTMFRNLWFIFRNWLVWHLERFAPVKYKCQFQDRWFGATYEDGLCCGGYMWDLDSGDSPGELTSGGNDPCPICRGRGWVSRQTFKKINGFDPQEQEGLVYDQGNDSI